MDIYPSTNAYNIFTKSNLYGSQKCSHSVLSIIYTHAFRCVVKMTFNAFFSRLFTFHTFLSFRFLPRISITFNILFAWMFDKYFPFRCVVSNPVFSFRMLLVRFYFCHFTHSFALFLCFFEKKTFLTWYHIASIIFLMHCVIFFYTFPNKLYWKLNYYV